MANKRTKEQEAERTGLAFGALTPWCCRGCAWAHGEPPHEDFWMKAHCMIYEYPEDKPNALFEPEKYDWGGEPYGCEFFDPETEQECGERLEREKDFDLSGAPQEAIW